MPRHAIRDVSNRSNRLMIHPSASLTCTYAQLYQMVIIAKARFALLDDIASNNISLRCSAFLLLCIDMVCYTYVQSTEIRSFFFFFLLFENFLLKHSKRKIGNDITHSSLRCKWVEIRNVEYAIITPVRLYFLGSIINEDVVVFV